MPTSTQILTVSQWLSPAYPVGAFAYSHGLESAIAAGWILTPGDLRAWLADLLDHGAGRNDALLIAAAYRATDPFQVDAIARAFAPSRERLLESDAQGAAFCKITAAVWSRDLAGLTYPVALGRAAGLESLPLELVQTLYLQALLSNLIAAAQRLMALGQTRAQTILAGFAADLPRIAAATARGDLDDMASAAFLSDIASMRHETQSPRIFRT